MGPPVAVGPSEARSGVARVVVPVSPDLHWSGLDAVTAAVDA
jgi:hypothetical protein